MTTRQDMNLSCDTTAGRIATEHPLATRVFARHGIDFCCGGGKLLRDVCVEKGLDSVAVLDEITKELGTSDTSEQRWDQAPLADLVEHILRTYHGPLR